MITAINIAKNNIKNKMELVRCLRCGGNTKMQSNMRRSRCTRDGCRKYSPIERGILYNSNIEVSVILELLFYIITGDTSRHIK
ncbi:hypothetical protein COBT_003098, partial [Conglomerata obtusa]